MSKAKNYRLGVQPKEGAADQLVRTGQQNDKQLGIKLNLHRSATGQCVGEFMWGIGLEYPFGGTRTNV